MVITVHLHTILQRQTPTGLVNRIQLDLPQGSTIANLLDALQIELNPEAILILVNRRLADLELVLTDGDTVNLMPALSGG